MSSLDNVRFVRMMLRTFRTDDWADWEGRPATDLIDSWASAGVRRALFEPLTQAKFELPCGQISAAWLGARLHAREGSLPFGYIPGTTWTKSLCDRLREALSSDGVTFLTGMPVTQLECNDHAVQSARCGADVHIVGDVFVSALPTPVYRRLAPHDRTPEMNSIRYTALVSAVWARLRRPIPDRTGSWRRRPG
jgi:protoporphyrinogen oxidase